MSHSKYQKKLDISTYLKSKKPSAARAQAAMVNAEAGSGNIKEDEEVTKKITKYVYMRRYDRKNSSIIFYL
jgi:hypothetical protein